ncbi:MAG: hypothetical protein LOD88_09420 [Novibacillus thermophilus]|nr:hypothetical protein [Novibacillus thermophilus]
MFQAYGVTFEQYCLELDTRIEVERLREEDYKQSNAIVSQYNSQSHKR